MPGECSPSHRVALPHSRVEGKTMQDQTIPKRLHFVWVGSPIPGHLLSNVSEWRALHPDWSVHIWTDKNIPILRNSDLYQRAKSVVPLDAVGQFRADILRYELLYDFGGFYADMDTRPLRPIDDAIGGHDVFAAMEDQNWVGNTVLGAIPGHPVMKELVSVLPLNAKYNRGMRPNKISGPQFLTPVWKRHKAHTDPSELWYPYSYRDVINGTVPSDLGNAYIEHQWDHTRRVLKSRGRTDV